MENNLSVPNVPVTQSQQTSPVSVQTNNSKALIVSLIALEVITLLVAGYFGYQFMQLKKVIQATEPTPISQKTTNPTDTPTQTQISATTSIDNAWNLYTNNKFGFSMKLPKTASAYSGACNNGKLDVSMVPVKTFDDDNGTYISYEYFYEYPINNLCQKTTNNLNIIQQRANQWKSGNGNNLIVPSNWHIVTAQVENDTQLDSFIKTNYGTGCKLGAKSLSPTGEYDVKIDNDGLDLEISKCPINFIYVVKYSPKLQKVATWGVGQEVVFSSSGYKETYDSEMVNSFKFIQ